MNTLRAAAQQAMDALYDIDATGVPVGHIDLVIDTLRSALAQQEEEPEGGWQSAPSPQVTQRIADMPMSEYRRGVNDGFTLGLREVRIKAEDEMREQPEQALVAWMVYTQDGKSVCVTDNPADFTDEHRALPLFTHPPRREWRSLSKEEIKNAVLGDPFGGAALMSMMRDGVVVAELRQAIERIARAVEAALKERNA
jgi:hypothetical protein